MKYKKLWVFRWIQIKGIAIDSFQEIFLLTCLDKEASWKRKHRTENYSIFMNKNNKRQL